MALIIALTFVAALTLYWGLAKAALGGRWEIAARLRQIRGAGAPVDAEAGPLSAPFEERVLKPAMAALARLMRRLTPRTLVEATERRLTLAGYRGPLHAEDILGLQAAAAVAGGVLGVLLAGAVHGGSFLLVIVLVIAGLYIPQFPISTRITWRRQRIVDDLPDALDLMVVSVEAGLGFDAALAKVSEKLAGPLSDGFRVALQQAALGTPRREALKDFAERAAVPELTTFVNSVLQADRLGAPIGDVLRVQSDSMREVRRQRSEEKAMKAPVKMLFPMVLFILPALLLIVLGPGLMVALKAVHL